MATEILTKILFLIAVIDPLGSVPVYLEATKHFDQKHKRKIAIRASLIAYLILLFFILVGQIILEGMDVSLDAFQISGGVILFLFAIHHSRTSYYDITGIISSLHDYAIAFSCKCCAKQNWGIWNNSYK